MVSLSIVVVSAYCVFHLLYSDLSLVCFCASIRLLFIYFFVFLCEKSPHPQENLYTKEEMKVTWETRKILGVPDMAVRSVGVVTLLSLQGSILGHLL